MSLLSFDAPYEKCPVCNGRELADETPVAVPGEHIARSRCGDCGLVFQNPPLTAARLRDLYARANYFDGGAYRGAFLQDDLTRIAQGRRRIAHIIRVAGKTGGRLLDVGSASGFFGVAAREAGFDVTCIEPDRRMAEFGARTYGLSFMAAPVEECELEPESYDVVTIWGTDGVLLHPVHSIARLVAA